MAKAILTVKLMLESPEINPDSVAEKATKIISELGGKVGKTEIEPIAFGLKAIILMLVADEDLGSDLFEEKLINVEGVSNAQVIDFRRALG